jgi:hypothetical protein
VSQERRETSREPPALIQQSQQIPFPTRGPPYIVNTLLKQLSVRAEKKKDFGRGGGKIFGMDFWKELFLQRIFRKLISWTIDFLKVKFFEIWYAFRKQVLRKQFLTATFFEKLQNVKYT